MLNSLIEHLQKIKDFRSSSGQRYPLYFILIIVILGMAQGYTSYRAIGDFAKSNREYLTRYFHFLRSSVPSYSTIRRAMINIDHDQVIEVFNDWANMIAHSNHQIKDDDLECIGIDAKSLVSTLTDTFKSKQNFVSIISGFSQDTQMVVAVSIFKNKEQSEMRQTQSLIEKGLMKNKIFTSL